jgi:TonB family protein
VKKLFLLVSVTTCLLFSSSVAMSEPCPASEYATVLVGKDEPVAGERVIKIRDKAVVVPLWAIEVKPQPVSIPEAEYPEAARKAGIEGLVVVEALVDIDGSVVDARILKPSGNASLDQAALAAARKAKFSPATGRDPAVQMWVTIPYRFVLTSVKGTTPARSISLVTTEAAAPPLKVKSYNDSVLKPLHGLHFVRLKPIAPRAGAHGRLVPDSAAIRFNNEAMMAAFAAFRDRRGDSLRGPASYYLQSDWYYLVIDSDRCRVFQRNHPRYPSSRAEVHNIDRLDVRPGSINADYLEMPSWTALPQYVPLKLEFDAGRMRRTIQAQTFGHGVQ